MISIVIIIAVVNLIGYLLMGYDKGKAKRNEQRVSERTFFIIATLFGSIGIYMGMKKFRHKTRHTSFSLGIPSILFIQLILIGVIFYFINLE